MNFSIIQNRIVIFFEMSLKVILPLIWMLISVSCLHLQLQPSHLSYTESLRAQQQQFLDRMQKLTSKIKAFKQQSPESTEDQIRLIEELIIEERALIDEASRSININLNESDQSCEAIPQDSKQTILQASNKVDSELDKLYRQIGSYSENVKGTHVILQETQFVDKDNAEIPKTLFSAQQDIDNVPDVLARTDILAPNWFLGKLTMDDIEKSYTAQRGQIIEECPNNKPFFTQHQCINCIEDTPYFNMYTKKCEACEKFDIKNHQCLDPPKFDSTNFEVAANRVIVGDQKKLEDYQKEAATLCPGQMPFFNGESCISCEQLFSLESKECTVCKNTQEYKAEVHLCMKKQLNGTRLGAKGLLLAEDKTMEDYQKSQAELSKHYNLTQCPQNTPFSNGKDCIKCDHNLYFSVQKRNCVSCPHGTFYNSKDLHCEAKSYYSNIGNHRWISKETSASQLLQLIASRASKTGSQACPDEKPFYTGSECIGCPEGNIFSFDQKQCVACPQSSVFSRSTHRCVSPQLMYQTNPAIATNLVYSGKHKNFWFHQYYGNLLQNPDLIDCPEDRPNYDSISCIRCPESYPYFNMEYKWCQHCGEGTAFSQEKQECLDKDGNPSDGTPQSDPSAFAA